MDAFVHEIENEDGTTTTIELSGKPDEGNHGMKNGAVSPVMSGRRQIFTNELEITPANVISVLNKAMETHRKNRA